MMQRLSVFIGLLLAGTAVFGGLAADQTGRITWEEGYNVTRQVRGDLLCFNETVTVHPRWYGLVLRSTWVSRYNSGRSYNCSSFGIISEGEVFRFNDTLYYLHKVVDGAAVVEVVPMEEVLN